MGKRIGHGKFTAANGDVYDGEWDEDQKNGNGKQIYKETGQVYDGAWAGN
jgi:hypothetical protein